MSTLLEQPLDSTVMPPFPVRRWTVAEYRHLADIGVLTEDDNVELLEGWIVPKKTKNPPHEFCISRLRLVADCLSDGWLLRIQCAINTADSEPEPDGAIVRAPEERYLARHPRGPDDIQYVIEIADSTLARDRRKARLYAADGLPTYVIINLPDHQVEFHTEPAPEDRRYQAQRVLRPGEALPIILDGQTVAQIPVEKLLPPTE
jgi:hypothetical protein